MIELSSNSSNECSSVEEFPSDGGGVKKGVVDGWMDGMIDGWMKVVDGEMDCLMVDFEFFVK